MAAAVSRRRFRYSEFAIRHSLFRLRFILQPSSLSYRPPAIIRIPKHAPACYSCCADP